MPIVTFAVLQWRLPERWKALLTGLCISRLSPWHRTRPQSLRGARGCHGTFGATVLTKTGNVRTILRNTQFVAIALVTAVITTGATLILICTADGARKVLRYALVDLPGDQFWFFGSPPMPFIGAWRELLTNRHVILTLGPTYLALAILCWLLLRSWKGPLELGKDWRALAILMLVYGILSGVPLLGILSRHYVFPLVRVMVLVAMVVYANGGMPEAPAWKRVFAWRGLPRSVAVGFVALCLTLSVSLAAKSVTGVVHLERNLHAQAQQHNPYLGTEWNNFMDQAPRLIDSHRERSQLSLWSAYAALLEDHYGVFHPAEDYIIHTVGQERWRHYLATFKATDPEFVTTMGPVFSFEEWLQNERWEFYEALLDNYEPIGQVEHAVVWHRNHAPWRDASEDFQVVPPDPKSATYTIAGTAEGDRVAVVQVRYSVTNRWAVFPLLGKTPRYLANIEGSPRHLAISFPPYATQFEFPVQLPARGAVKISFSTASLLPGAAIRPEDVRVKTLPWDPEQKQIFAYLGQHRY